MDPEQHHGSAPSTKLLPRTSVAGVPIATARRDDLLSAVQRTAVRREPLDVHFVNAYTVSLTRKDDRYYDLLRAAGLNIADGTPVAMIARHRSRRDVHLRGPDAFRALLASSPQVGLRHFLLGGTDESLVRLRAAISAQYPDAAIVGAYSPPFRPLDAEDLEEIDAAIETSGCNVVWIGIGTPKQDFETARIAAHHGLTAIAVGAAFNFVSGDVREAPPLWRRTGLEWFYRLLSEPRRLWRRYLIGNVVFISLAATRWERSGG